MLYVMCLSFVLEKNPEILKLVGSEELVAFNDVNIALHAKKTISF